MAAMRHRLRFWLAYFSVAVIVSGVVWIEARGAARNAAAAATAEIRQQGKASCNRGNDRFEGVSEQLIKLGGTPLPATDCDRAWAKGADPSVPVLKCPENYVLTPVKECAKSPHPQPTRAR